MRACALLLLLASSARADFRGRVWSGDQPCAHAAVLLDDTPSPPPRVAHLDEVWLSFVPKVQVVPPGSTLVFTARDSDSHTVHAWYGKETLFNRASVPHGPEQRAVLDRPGVVAVTCDLHQEMRAWVLVSTSAYSAVSGPDGRFTVAVPAGRHHLRVWRPGESEPTDLGERLISDDEQELRLPAPAIPSAAPRAPPPVVERSETRRLPEWMRRLGARQSWPGGRADYVLSALAVPAGFALAWLAFWLAARRRWSVAAGVMMGCALAFGSGALSMLGLSAAVATALGFGAFMGTVIIGAHRTTSA